MPTHVGSPATTERLRPQTPVISAIIACYRDAPAVVEMYERLVSAIRSAECEPEVIFVNDASPDDAEAVLHRLCSDHPDVVSITHTRNFGSQSAFTSGMKVATGDAVVLLDGDLQDPPEIIPAMVDEWRKGFDVVVGERTRREAPFYMSVLYKAFYRLFRSASYIKIPLDAGDFSLLDRRVVNAMNELPEVNRFMRGLRAWVGFSQTSVPYVRPERKYGRTTNSFARNVGWARRAVISFSYKPLDMISIVALGIVGGSALLGALQVLAWMLNVGNAPKGFTMLLLVVLFLGGVQLLCLGILASYLAHIYDEVKRRPAFVVDHIRNEPRAANGPHKDQQSVESLEELVAQLVADQVKSLEVGLPTPPMDVASFSRLSRASGTGVSGVGRP